MKRIRVAKFVAAAAMAALAACSASQPGLLKADGVQRESADRAAYSPGLIALRDSALKLGEALLADGGDSASGNAVSSPGSLLIALAMLRAGAAGGTAAEMDAVLKLPGLKRDEAMNALLASLEQFDGDPGSVDEGNPPRKPVMHPANGLFVDQGVETGASYLNTLARLYGTGVYPVDFSDEAVTKPAIDAWVGKNTGGRITNAPAEYDRRNTFSLLNTLYFAAAWGSPFDPGSTFDAPFTTAAGEEINSPAMHTLLYLDYAEGPGWRGVDLPYAEGFVMRLVLPDAGVGRDTLTAQELGSIAGIVDSAQRQTVQIQLPKWDHRCSFDLRKVLQAMGLNNTLNTTVDFNSIQPDFAITQAAQAVNITVAEKGTVAAAATQFNGMVTSAPPQPDRTIEFDRPFHYQIVHVETGLPLFMGTVADPR
ncbi:serpin family protein [Arthrobacter sp. D1-17]